MSLWWSLVVFVIIFGILFKMFKGFAISLLLFILLELIIIVIKPEILTLLADFVVKTRGLLGS